MKAFSEKTHKNCIHSNSGDSVFVGEGSQPRCAQEGRGWKAALTGISTRDLNRILKTQYLLNKMG